MSPWEPHEPESPRDTYKLEAKLADTEAKRAALELDNARLRALVEEARGFFEKYVLDETECYCEAYREVSGNPQGKCWTCQARALLAKLGAPAAPGERETKETT